MKFVFPNISEPLVFAEDRVNTLVIENQSLFLSLIEDIYRQIDGEEGYSVLSENDVPISFSKNAELISAFVPFELNRRSLITKICVFLEKTAMNEEHFKDTYSLLANIESYVSSLTFDSPCDIEFSTITVASLIKALGVRVREDGDPLEKIVNYMELVREFERDKLFVFVNMRSYFPNDHMQLFFETVIKHKYKVLLIENCEYENLRYEKRVIIDYDLCEI